MDLASIFQAESPLPIRILSPSWSWADHLSDKFRSVSLTQRESNTLRLCLFEPESPYLIHKIERIGHRLIFHLDRPHGYQYCLSDHNASVVSDDDIDAVNGGRILYTLIKRPRTDTDVYDLVIE